MIPDNSRCERILFAGRDAPEPSEAGDAGHEKQPLLTDREVAELLRCSRRTVHKLRAEGSLPPAIKLGRTRLVRWSREEIERWIANRCQRNGQ